MSSGAQFSFSTQAFKARARACRACTGYASIVMQVQTYSVQIYTAWVTSRCPGPCPIS